MIHQPGRNRSHRNRTYASGLMRAWACRRGAERGYKDSNPDEPRVLETRRAPQRTPPKCGSWIRTSVSGL